VEWICSVDVFYRSGKLQTREWTDKSQVKRHTTEIIAQRVNALDSKRDGAIPAPTDGDIPPEWDQANQGEIPTPNP